MKLEFVAPTLKHGKPTACLMKSELEKETAKWKNAVILYVIGDTPTITYLTTFLRKQCQIEGVFEIFYHSEGYFVIRFEGEGGKEFLMYEGPHTIASRPIIVKEWVPNFSFAKEILREVPLWIQLPKLPLNCWSSDSLSRIGSVIGKPICADDCTSNQKRISYARLLVEVDVTQPLRYTIQVEGEKGDMVEQKVYYEWVPLFCKKCQVVGHRCNEVEKQIAPMGAQQKQWQAKIGGKEKESEKGRDKGKEVISKSETSNHVATEVWNVPKKVAPTTITVGNIQVSTANSFGSIEESIRLKQLSDEGGGLLPLHQT